MLKFKLTVPVYLETVSRYRDPQHQFTKNYFVTFKA